MAFEPVTIRTGETIVVDGHQVVIVNINNDGGVDGRRVTIHALDAESASKHQANQIQSDQIGQQAMSMIRQFLEGKFPGGMGGFGG